GRRHRGARLPRSKGGAVCRYGRGLGDLRNGFGNPGGNPLMSTDALRSGSLEHARASSLPAGILWRVFLRSFLLQASWNPQGMQNLGLAYALYPALCHLYPDRERQIAAVRRHLVFFNTHPYVAAAI